MSSERPIAASVVAPYGQGWHRPLACGTVVTLLLLGLSSCSPPDGFSSFEVEETLDMINGEDDTVLPVEIETYSPTTDPVVFLATTRQTFGVSVNSGSGEVTYRYELDGNPVQESNSPFYELEADDLDAGSHELQLIVSNSAGVAVHEFNLLKNSIPQITLVSQTATSIACGGGTFSLEVSASDDDGDAISYSYRLNGAAGDSTISGSSSTGGASLDFTPGCGLAGTNTVSIRATDARGESSDYSVSITVTTPSDAVEIMSFVPTADPVIFLSETVKTFGASVNPGSGAVTYRYELDNVIVQDSSSPFFELDADELVPGAHLLKVVASNSSGEDFHNFNLLKNTPPVISLVSQTALGVDCGADTFTLAVSASDADGDTLTYAYLLNGGTANPALAGSNTPASATVTFTPGCGLAGPNTVAIRVTDSKGEFSDHAVAVTVNNPNETEIVGYIPTGSNTVILSTGSEEFMLSAIGNPPLDYTWSISPGATIDECEGSSACEVAGGDFTPGAYTLTGTVSDAASTSDSHSFSLVVNGRPDITVLSPDNDETFAMNCSLSENFSVSIADANHSNPGQSYTVTWLLDGNIHSSLAGSTNTASHPMTSTATFSPGCNPFLLGDHSITVVVSDGYESDTATWNVNTNYLSNTCNQMGAGRICTLAGRPGMGSGLQGNDPEFAFYPNDIVQHPTGGWYISDGYYHVVWFYNTTSAAKTVLGQEVGIGEIRVVVGTGQNGNGTNGQNARNFYLDNPVGMAPSSDGGLYIASYNNSRIVRVEAAGTASQFAVSGSSDAENSTRLNRRCANPRSLVLDEAASRLFVTCYGNSTANTHAGVVSYRTDVDQSNAFVLNGTNGNGSTGSAGTARIARPYSLVRHPGKDIVYVGDFSLCQIFAASYGGTETYFSGAPARSLAANNVLRLTDNAGCGATLSRAFNDTTLAIRTYGLAVKMDGSTMQGIFTSILNNHIIGFLNTTASSITIGGRAVASGFVEAVFGNGSPDKVRLTPASTASQLWNPLGISADSTRLYIADRDNGSVTTLVHNVNDGAVSDLAGGETIAGYDGEGAAGLNSIRLNLPLGISVDTVANTLYFSDYGNFRIRKIDLETGLMSTAVGRGTAGSANTNPESVVEAYSRMVMHLHALSDLKGLIYSDMQDTNIGTVRNCVARYANLSSSTESVFGVSIPSGSVSTVAGSFPLGCQTYSTSSNGTAAITAALRSPTGIIASTGANSLYVASELSNCILKVSSTGQISIFAGTCGAAAADVSGSLSVAQFGRLGGMALDGVASLRAYDNFFFVDNAHTTGSSIKYINNSTSSVEIAGVTIDSGEVGKVATGFDYGGSVASFEDQLCYTQGYTALGSSHGHTVTCINRDTGVQTLRAGRAPANTVKGGMPRHLEDEGVLPGSALLAEPYGLAFDGFGNLYISLYQNQTIKKVKRWFD